MKFDLLITFRSVTFAQKGERWLKGADIACSLSRTPKELSQRGCGYCLRLRAADGSRAVALLRENQSAFGKVYGLSRGYPEELAL